MDFLDGLTVPTISGAVGTLSVFKLLFFVVLVGYVFFAFLLTLRVRILSDTVKVGPSRLVETGVYLHLVFALLGSFVAILISFLA